MEESDKTCSDSCTFYMSGDYKMCTTDDCNEEHPVYHVSGARQ